MLEYLVEVAGSVRWDDLLPADDALLIDDKRGPFAEALGTQHAVISRHLTVEVAEERKRADAAVASEGSLSRIGVDAYAQNLGVELFEPGVVELQFCQLLLSDGREGQRKEEENHVLLTSKVAEGYLLAQGALADEIRRFFPHFDHN